MSVIRESSDGRPSIHSLMSIALVSVTVGSLGTPLAQRGLRIRAHRLRRGVVLIPLSALWFVAGTETACDRLS
jgi:hypothetical protein